MYKYTRIFGNALIKKNCVFNVEHDIIRVFPLILLINLNLFSGDLKDIHTNPFG